MDIIPTRGSAAECVLAVEVHSSDGTAVIVAALPHSLPAVPRKHELPRAAPPRPQCGSYGDRKQSALQAHMP